MKHRNQYERARLRRTRNTPAMQSRFVAILVSRLRTLGISDDAINAFLRGYAVRHNNNPHVCDAVLEIVTFITNEKASQ